MDVDIITAKRSLFPVQTNNERPKKLRKTTQEMNLRPIPGWPGLLSASCPKSRRTVVVMNESFSYLL